MLEEALARGWENLVGRWGGPMSFRFLIQPAVAILFAIRAGLKDAREHEPPFLWALLSNPGARQERLRQVWKDVGKVFVVALILDSIYQVIVHAGIFTLELLITATVLALVPYFVSRDLVTRIAKRAGVGKQSAHSTVHHEERAE
jgi:drug/metabolite transporter (DMT)-like permease